MRCSSFSRLKCGTGILACLLLKTGKQAGMPVGIETDRQECLSYLLSFPQSANVRNQGVDLLFRDFLSIRRHLALAVHDGVEYSLVTYPALPLGIGQISSMFRFAL